MGVFGTFRKKCELEEEPKRASRFGLRMAGSITAGQSADGAMLCVEDTLSIAGKGCVVTGWVEQGFFAVGDLVEVVGSDGKTTPLVLVGIEALRTVLAQAGPGENVGLLLRGPSANTVCRGDVVRKRSD